MEKEIIERVARGLRNMRNKPDFFIQFDTDQNYYYDRNEILGITIIKTEAIYQGNGQDEMMFYPCFLKSQYNDNKESDIYHFRRGYE